MNWTFYLDGTLISEPIGFADIILKIKRDDQWHGIFFEATTSDLQFYGDAADYLMNKKRTEGFGAEVTFSAEVDCGTTQEVFTGKLDFRQYKEKCSATCFVVIPVEQDGCTMTLRNRYDQKVDLSDRMAFDKLTVLPNYNGLNFGMTLAAQKQKARIEGYEPAGGETFNMGIFPTGLTSEFRGKKYAVRPDYNRIVVDSIEISHLIPEVQAASDNGLNDSVLSPILLLENLQECYQNEITYEGRIKGHIAICLMDSTFPGGNASFEMRVEFAKGNDVPFGASTVLHTATIASGIFPEGPFFYNFDLIFSGSTILANGEGLFPYFILDTNSDTVICPDTDIITYTREIVFDEETYIVINSEKECPPTDCEVSLIHEAASRVVEAITDRCLVVKSDYYGRTDSEPYEAAEDGCGSLRVLTSGLRIRVAEIPKHFLSLKELFESLNAIDNIGMGIENAGIYDPLNLRIEQVEYFYQDVEIARHVAIPSAEFTLQSGMVYSLVNIGYQKWETENVNGLDEFNSNKEFRTSLKSITNTLDQTSGFIAGGYPIEHTRQQSFVATGEADTKYDNDTFIICVRRDYAAYGNYEVEQGNIDSGANFYSPATAYNWRIRPLYNLIRWWKSIAQSYVNLLNTASKLFFSAGVGNLLAEGQLLDACDVARGVLPENHDLAQGDVDLAKDYLPIWKPETMNYAYPMSLAEYNAIKAGPKGYIYAECGSGPGVKGFISNINYRLAKGEADITLKLKWV